MATKPVTRTVRTFSDRLNHLEKGIVGIDEKLTDILGKLFQLERRSRTLKARGKQS